MNEFALPENLARDLYRQQGADQERERIIALLEADIAQCKPTHNCEDCEPVRYCIALIKGEQ